VIEIASGDIHHRDLAGLEMVTSELFLTTIDKQVATQYIDDESMILVAISQRARKEDGLAKRRTSEVIDSNIESLN